MRQSSMQGTFGRLATVVATAVATATVYFVAQARDRAKSAAVAPTVPAWNQGRVVEAPGIEGTFTAQGLQVTALEGNARQWGLELGDVVRSIAGQPLTSDAQLRGITAGVTLELLRNGAPTTVTVSAAVGPGPADVRPVETRGLAGQLTPEGLWVSAVQGEAAAWGLRPGDLVRSVDGRPLTIRRDAFSLLNTLDASRGFAFDVVRGGARLAIPVSAQAQAGWRAWLTGAP